MTSRITTLAKHRLSPAAELWLRERAASPETPVQILKVQLHQSLPRDFSPELIDPRLYTSGEITPMGLWRIDRQHPRLQVIDRTIREIQRRVKTQPPPTRLTAAEIALTTDLNERAVGEALYVIGSLGSFFSGAAGTAEHPNAWTTIELAGPHAYDEYLRYDGLEGFLEQLYRSRGSGFDIALSHSTLHPNLGIGKMPELHRPNYLLLVLGIILLLVPLAFATMSPDAFQRADWYLRVIAGFGGAMITAAAIPGTIKAKVPGVQVAGPIAVFAILYFFNPPAVLHQALSQDPPTKSSSATAPATQWLTASLTVPGCGQSGCYAPAKVCGPLPTGKKFTGNTRGYIDSFSGAFGQWGDGPTVDGQHVCKFFIQHSHNVQRDVSFEYEVSE